jgi:hypothetical protein
MPRGAEDTTDWLTPTLRAWVGHHGAALDAIVAAFVRDNAWPDPVELERGLRAEGDPAGVLAAVTTMPRALGWRDHSPSRVTLTLFGLACVPRARSLLEALLNTMWVALARFDDPSVPAILSRGDVATELGLDDDAMNVLSLILLGPGNFFLAGGNANLDEWRLAIDERVVLYQDVDGVDGLIRQLAAERLNSPPLELAPATVDSLARPMAEEQNGLQSVLVVAAAVLGLGADAAGLCWLLCGSGLG